MFCTNCGEKLLDGATFCTNCGEKITKKPVLLKKPGTVSESGNDSAVRCVPSENEPVVRSAVNLSTEQNPGSTAPSAPVSPTHGFAVASMVLGIVSSLTGWLQFIALPTGILAIIFSVKCRKSGYNSGMAKTGMITGIVGLCLTIFWFVCCFAIGNNLPE